MSTTVVVAREFRGQRLFLTSSKPREFTWSANRALAMQVSVAVALRIINECEEFSKGTDAFAIDKDDCVIARVSNGAIQHLHRSAYRAGRVYCLIFDDPKDLGGYLLALGTRCETADEARVLLSDRMANGDAFSSERVADMPLDEYTKRNSNGGWL